jgi:hypothetical protein
LVKEFDMSPVSPSMTLLFEQLGLEPTPEAIQAFITTHRFRPGGFDGPIQEAPFWTPAQSELLGQALADDSEWSGLVDRLDSGLRQTPPVGVAGVFATSNETDSTRIL